MTVDQQERNELRDLLWSMEEGTISAAGIERIDLLVRGNTGLLRFYVNYTQQISDLRLAPHSHRVERVLSGLFSTNDLTSTIATEEPASWTASDVLPPFPNILPTTLQGATGCLSSGWPVAYLVAAVIFGIGLVVGAIVHVSVPTQTVRHSPTLPSPLSTLPSAVGHVTGMVDCVWEESGFRVQGSGDRNLPSPLGRGAGGEGGQSLIRLGDRLALKSGLLEVTYDTGAKVILQGPVTYEVESPAGGYLSIGKLTARLEKDLPSPFGRGAGGEGGPNSLAAANSRLSDHQSEITNHTFAVRTPTATVTDLGTEFGVEVDRSGVTKSHVFRGSVKVQRLSADGTANGAGHILHTNESACVESSAGRPGENRPIVVVPSANTTDFVREIPKHTITVFDLVDVVVGGDGFSGRRNRGINPTNGRIVAALPETHQMNVLMSGDERYHRVTEVPFVDGVFIPNGTRGEVQVDSAGHVFDGFLGTANTTWQHIWAGNTMRQQGVPTKLGEVDYASPGHEFVYLCANNAITFDLAAIRRANAGCRLLRFRAVAGNSAPDEFDNLADIWVLVDGKARFQRRQIYSSQGVFSIAVPIGAADRFLTLAATDGGDGISHDWVIFGDPRLELLGVEKNEPSSTNNR